MRDVSDAAAMTRSILHKKVRELDASTKQSSLNNKAIRNSDSSATNKGQTAEDNKEPSIAVADRSASASAVKVFKQSRSGICNENKT